MNQEHVPVNASTNGTAILGGPAGQVKVANSDSFNRQETEIQDSYNDNSSHYLDNRKTYRGPVYESDTYNGVITDSIVGGRGNTNHIISTSHGASFHDVPYVPEWETDLQEEIRKLREQVAARRREQERKKEQERKNKLEEEIRRLKEELGDP